MANSVIGRTDTSNALSASGMSAKSFLIIAERKLDTGETSTTAKNLIFGMASTGEAKEYFGSLSKVPEMVRIALSNGVSNIKGMIIGEYGVSKDYTSIVEAYSAALTASLGDPTIEGISLDTNDATVLAVLDTHLDAAELEDLFRYSAAAPDNIASDAAISTFAGTLNNKRIFVPSSNFVDASQTKVSGVYSCVGLCSAIMANKSDPALPLNTVEIHGFGGVDRSLLNSQKLALANAGVVAIYNSGSGNPTINRLVTSYTKNSEAEADVTWQEGTTVFIADNVLESVIVDLRGRFKRTKNVTRILSAINDAVINVLEAKQGLEIIENFDKKSVTTVKDPKDIYGALVDYNFDVVTPLYTITINQHMKL